MLSKHLSKPPKAEKKTTSERKEAQLKRKTTFTNILPDVPYDAKFLASGVDFQRMALYTNNTMVKYNTHSLDFGPLMGIHIETADPDFYAVDKSNPPQLHPSDRYLLEEESTQKKEVDKRARVHRQPVPFMRKAVVIPSYKHMGVNKQRTETTIGYSMAKKGVNFNEALYRNRTEQIAAIEKTFEDVKKPVTKHYQKEGVTAVEEFMLLPDISNFVHEVTQVDFDKDPTPLSVNEELRKLALEKSHLYSLGNQSAVGHFIPTDETLQRILEEDEDNNNTRESAPLEYFLSRDYSYKNDETMGDKNIFYFRRDGDNFVYNPILKRVVATRIRRTAGQKMNPWSLEISWGKPTEKCFKDQRKRVEKLLYKGSKSDDEEQDEDEDMLTDASDQPHNEPAPEPATSVSSDDSSDDNSSSDSSSSTSSSSQPSDKPQKTPVASDDSDNEQGSQNRQRFEAGMDSEPAQSQNEKEQAVLTVKEEPVDDVRSEYQPAAAYDIMPQDDPVPNVKQEPMDEEYPN